ncbi:dTDP-4-dehydrorhamnose reductase [Pseudoduganella lurida]|uniref:dTDP-4-dehydrorhamnose reductase n=1 Tax=Pseudoduganella lurida TaxID=1036180 RepID=A0A562REA5_9BURK|nr:family 1 glycosylhydrolase [Pseudoduganella lurida]TWI67358.1 dTDP-4-dehydrorhamnose reductase [Pseudoduganella lurida]
MGGKNQQPERGAGLELWGGLECTVNRVSDQYFSQMERNGHIDRPGDIERFASLGIRAVRYPVLWECTAPDGIESADWSWSDERLPRLRELGVEPIAGLVHHGSGPRHTSLVSPCFAEKLAEYAGAVAQRYPWLTYYTPVNEPLTTARFSGLSGVWYPHGRSEALFVRALLNQCRGTVLAMRAIRAVNPDAKLVQTDDLSRTYGTPEMAHLVDFFNERRWLAWDLLCGMVGPEHALYGFLLDAGASAEELQWLQENPCPPDIVGVNYYITSERWLDHRVENFPASHVHEYKGVRHADMETARVLANPTPGIEPLLGEVWERYRLPVAITETHIDAHREDQLRWLRETWQAAQSQRSKGADIRAVTVWALLGSFDWNCLVTACHGYYEPGPFDVRGAEPRATAVAALMRELASGRAAHHPVLRGSGWWHRPGRFLCKPVAAPAVTTSLTERQQARGAMPPLLVAGAGGALARAFSARCQTRNLPCVLAGRDTMDVTDPAAVDRMIREHKPWAIVNAAGARPPLPGLVDAAEEEAAHQALIVGASVLAAAAVRHGIPYLMFSSAAVLGGAAGMRDESAEPAPDDAFGRAQAEAEARVLRANPRALIVRSGHFFGADGDVGLLGHALAALREGHSVALPSDLMLAPAYLPDLVDACLDLAVDGEEGVWHLYNDSGVSASAFVARAASLLGLATMNVDVEEDSTPVLSTRRGKLLPSLDYALDRFTAAMRARAADVERREAPRVGRG